MLASCQERLIRLVHYWGSHTLLGITNGIKNGPIRENVPPAYDSILLQWRPQLLSDRFENLIHNIFRNKNSTLEINESFFGVLHWQQWQPPASTPGYHNALQVKIWKITITEFFRIFSI